MRVSKKKKEILKTSIEISIEIKGLTPDQAINRALKIHLPDAIDEAGWYNLSTAAYKELVKHAKKFYK